MKVEILRSSLVQAIGKLQSIVPARPTLPILANISLEAKQNELILSATDLTISMQIVLEAKVLEEGSLTLPARRFFQLIRELISPQVTISSPSGDTALIHAGSSHFKIQGMQRQGFPPLPELTGSDEVSLSSSTLKEMFVKSAFSAAEETNQHVLNGIFFQLSGGKGIFIGTDGKRLSRLSTALTANEGLPSAILPLRAVEEMIKILDEKELPARLQLSQDKAALVVGSTILTTKLLAGDYPDVSRIIPKKAEKPISLHREELSALLRQVALFVPDHVSPVHFIFQDNELELSVASSDIGEGKVSMPVNYSGERLEIAFNPYYFLDVLRHSKEETVGLTVSDPYAPGLISDSTEAEFILMPMRLEG